MYIKQHPVNLNSVSTATALAAHDEELADNYAEHEAIVQQLRQVATAITGTPSYTGQIAVVAGVGYMAVGTSSSADWKQVTN